MSGPQIALIIPLGGGFGLAPVDPGFGVGAPGHVSPPIFHPGHPDHGLPSGGHPSQPIFHPGHPGHPSHGLPNGPGHIDNSLPNIPGLPSQGLPVSPGHPVTLPTPIPPPTGELATDLVVAVWNPNTKTWKVTSWDLDASAGHPLPPTASPKS